MCKQEWPDFCGTCKSNSPLLSSHAQEVRKVKKKKKSQKELVVGIGKLFAIFENLSVIRNLLFLFFMVKYKFIIS